MESADEKKSVIYKLEQMWSEWNVIEETVVVLRKVQEKIKWQVDKKRREAKEWKKRNKIMLSIKDLVFKKRPVKKLVNWYISLYIIDKIVFTNAVKLQLLTSMRIHLVVNVSCCGNYLSQWQMITQASKSQKQI